MQTSGIIVLLFLVSCGSHKGDSNENSSELIPELSEREFARDGVFLPLERFEPVAAREYVTIDESKLGDYIGYLQRALEYVYDGKPTVEPYFQAILDEMDAKVREVGRVEDAPRPIALPMDLEPTIAAAVPSVSFCLEIPTAVSLASGPTTHSDDNVIAIDSAGQLIEQKWSEACVNDLVTQSPRPEVLLEKAPMMMPDGCDGSFSMAEVNISCAETAPVVIRFRGIAIGVKSQYVLYNTNSQRAYQASGQENFLAFIAAHELAHFYEGPSFWQIEFNAFYHLDRRTWPLRPTNDPTLKEQGLAAFIATHSQPTARTYDVLVAANRSRIGWYTAEDRAHEFAVNLLANLGVDAGFATKTYVLMASEQPSDYAASLSDCIERYNNLWNNPEGNVNPPPTGPFGYHHDFCFEAFTIDQQILGNGYHRAALEPKPGSVIGEILNRSFDLRRAPVQLKPTYCGSTRDFQKQSGIKN